MPKSSEALATSERKRHNRNGYKLRIIKKWRIPIFDKNTQVDDDYLRLHIYNKKHKCQHGKRFNVLRYFLDPIPHFEAFCKHHGEIYGEGTGVKCENCEQRETLNVIVSDKHCRCKVTECPRCKYRTYETSYVIKDFNLGYETERRIPVKNIVCCCLNDHHLDLEEWRKNNLKNKAKPKWGVKSREEWLKEFKQEQKKKPSAPMLLSMVDFPPLGETLPVNVNKATGATLTTAYTGIKNTALETYEYVKRKAEAIIKNSKIGNKAAQVS